MKDDLVGVQSVGWTVKLNIRSFKTFSPCLLGEKLNKIVINSKTSKSSSDSACWKFLKSINHIQKPKNLNLTNHSLTHLFLTCLLIHSHLHSTNLKIPIRMFPGAQLLQLPLTWLRTEARCQYHLAKPTQQTTQTDPQTSSCFLILYPQPMLGRGSWSHSLRSAFWHCSDIHSHSSKSFSPSPHSLDHSLWP